MLQPSFFSWKAETVLFFLAEKEKNGFKKRPMSAIGPYKHPGTLLENLRDCHASDIGHWLAMTPIFWADGVVRPYKLYP